MLEPSSKRKKRETEQKCIIHESNIKHSETNKFVPLSNVKGNPQEKLDYLLSICSNKMKQANSISFARKLETIFKTIPKTVDGLELDSIGYHSECYKSFTKNAERFKVQLSKFSSTVKAARSPRKSAPLGSLNLFPAECIFCDKIQRKVKGRTENCQTFPVFKKNKKVKEESWREIEPRAIKMNLNRLVRKVKGEDLFAKRAMYHKSSFKEFGLKYINYLKTEDKSVESPSDSQSDTDSAHNHAFGAVIDMLSKVVVEEKHVTTLSKLRILYVSELEKYGCVNASLLSKKLKSKLDNCRLQTFLGFSQINKSGCIIDYIIYNAKLSVEDVVAAPYNYGYANGCNPKKAAASLHDFIASEHAKCTPLPWPPTVADLESENLRDSVSDEMLQLFNILINGADNDDANNSELVASICQVRKIM